MSEGQPAKLAIVGAGAVGSTLAYACLIRGLARTVALYDIDARKVRAEALDLAQGSQFLPAAEVIGSDDIEVCRGADVVVITAGAKQKPGQSRMDLAASTVAMTRQMIGPLVDMNPRAVFIMVTNPVDVVTYAAAKLSGLPANQLFGSGTVLDSSRLRHLLARRCDVAVANVHAYMAGEHGDTEIALWSAATIGGVPLLDWEAGTGRLDAAERDQIAHQVVNAAYEIIEGKGATNYAVGLAASRIIESVLRDERRIMPVSTMIDEWFGISDVCMSVPTVVDRSGAAHRLALPLSADELTRLRASADTIRAEARALGF